VATIDPRNGRIRGVSAGNVEITARGADNRTARFSLAVEAAAVVDATPTRPDPRRVATPDSTRVATPPPSRYGEPAPPPVAEKTEAELVADAQRTMAGYVRALESRDTTQIRRVFAAAPAKLVTDWQALYDGTEQLKVALNSVAPIERLAIAPGTLARFSVSQSNTFTVKGERKSQTRQAAYTATLRRDQSGWVLVGISER
jgi:hypothetical protein